MSLEVKLPSLEKQKQIAQISELAKREEAIYNQIKDNRALVVNTMLEKAIT